MKLQETIEMCQRILAFARHMPPQKIARRIQLDIKHRLHDRFARAEKEATPSPPVSPNPPQPIFPARQGLMREQDGQLLFRFVGRDIAIAPLAINWNAAGSGVRNQLWNMNLHYMEYLEAADDSRFSDLVRQWIASNKSHKPGVWRDSFNSYALSIRTLVWMQQLSRSDRTLAPVLVGMMNSSLAQQLRYLERNLETDLGGNHLMKNIKALLWASAYFTGPQAARWRESASALLARELSVQILADGMHYERSPSYHAQILADLLECRHALACDPLQGRLDQALSRMAQALADLTDADGGPILFNDSGLTMAYAPSEVLAAYTAITDQRVEPRRVFSFPRAGYFGLRSEKSYFVADCGRIAPDDLPAHGHADVLSFVWSVAGQRFIVDQGVFEYVDGAKRKKSRAASSHNTLSVELADQADFFGAFRCGRRPNVSVRIWRPGADRFTLEGSHDGYGHLPGGPVHVRRFDVSAEAVVISDSIEGGLDCPCRISFLLHPAVEVSIDDKKAHLMCRGTSIILESGAPVRKQEDVWWPDMGQEIATFRLVIDLPPGTKQHQTCLILTR